jgi:tagatose-1,6-bisphosphate aldolase non-catalytic subunit AgaZ/GatZ
MSEEIRVYASMLVRNNVVPDQVLFEAGCTDYQDEHAYPALAQAAENLMRLGCESTDDEDALVA